MKHNKEKYYSIGDICAKTKLSRSAVYSWRTCRTIPAHYLLNGYSGIPILFKKDKMDEFLARRGLL